jgi:hypothetical protein
MALNRLNLVAFGETPVPIHDKGDMLGYRALLERPNEELA